MKLIKPKFTKLNIGCGYEKKEGFVNIDKAREVNPDYIVDIEKGLPFPDNSFDYIFSQHCLEHVRPQYWKFVLDEIARVAKDGCILELYLPFDNIWNRTNSDHYRTFHWTSFAQNEVGSNRFYYTKLKLKRIEKVPNRIVRAIYVFFPIFFKEVHFKYRIIKK
ncbi:MAG: methyltransferase domain-containing protein [Candidatus Omnitrophica bacterium]|nr:methyltransferase domain-containing protein [Candidatus Omnitrophota bacterium]